MMTHAPMNIAHRRPNLSDSRAAKGDVTIVPLNTVLAQVECFKPPQWRWRKTCRNVHRVKGADDGHLGPVDLGTECVLETLHSSDRADERAIITVGTGTGKCNEDGKVKLDRFLAPSRDGRFLDCGEELSLNTGDWSVRA